MLWPNLKFVALPVPEIIVIGVLVGARTPNLGEGGSRRGSGMVPFERAKVSSYRPPIVTFYCAMHFSAKRGLAIACRLSVRLSVCP